MLNKQMNSLSEKVSGWLCL